MADFFQYIHAVGTGTKGNRDLSHEEAFEMMTQILNQEATPEQISAFLLGWRIKPETIEEFQGALAACDALVQKQPLQDSLELGYPFDGKVNNPYMLPLIAKILEDVGLDLVSYTDLWQPAKKGITLQDISSKIDTAKNLHLFERKDYLPQLHALTSIRKNLGLRTGLNTLEKLPYVTQSRYALTGVFHKPYVKKHIDIFANRYERFALIQGNEGTPELFSKGRLWLHQNGEVQEFIIDPHDYGIEYTKSWEKITLNESIAQTNEPSEAFYKLAKLNAAVQLFIAQRFASIDEAFEYLQSKEGL